MSVTVGSSVSLTHLDASTDDPAQARAQIKTIGDRVNEIAGKTLAESKATSQVFTSSGTGTWSRPSGCTRVIVEVVGGGGGGGGTGATTDSTAGGGGGGGYARAVLDVSSISTSTITVGSGGSGGAAGNNNGANGGDSSWSDGINVVTGNGGDGGTGNDGSTNGVSGGSGGNNVGGDFGIDGQNGMLGHSASRDQDTNGAGGASHFSPPVYPNLSAPNGAELGQSHGGGGSGARSNAGSSVSGGTGADGIIVVTELY